jgi:hypothetical protein
MSKNYLLNQLAQHMQADLADAIGAQEEEILRAIAKASENGTDSEEPVKFAVTLRGVLNLDANTVETAFSFATRTSVKEKHALEDPKQATLPLEGVKKEFLPTQEQLVAPLNEALARAVSSRGAEMKNGPWSSVELDPEDKIRAKSAATALKGVDAYEAECEQVFAAREADGMFDTRAYTSRKKEGEE